MGDVVALSCDELCAVSWDDVPEESCDAFCVVEYCVGCDAIGIFVPNLDNRGSRQSDSRYNSSSGMSLPGSSK